MNIYPGTILEGVNEEIMMIGKREGYSMSFCKRYKKYNKIFFVYFVKHAVSFDEGNFMPVLSDEKFHEETRNFYSRDAHEHEVKRMFIAHSSCY